MNLFKNIFFCLFLIFALVSCNDKESEPSRLTILFTEEVDDQIFQTDTIKYINEAGNPYMVTEVQYFISRLTLYYENGKSHEIQADGGIHYVDYDIPETGKWDITDEVPSGRLDSVAFIFGFNESDNQSGIFSDPPESLMFWPEMLGGGYHYMKLNGKWRDLNGNIKPFNFHLGIGQTYDTTGQVTGFVQNYFRVNFPLVIMSSPMIKFEPGETTELVLTMNINSWFSSPNTWDFNYWGGMMMQNQEAMATACENGKDAFRLSLNFEL